MKKLIKVYNRFIPLKGFNAITIFKWMFIREEYLGILPWFTENHENIHYAQECELAFIFYYLLYGIEYIFKLLFTWNFMKAYISVSFEQEAYFNMYDSNYLENRKYYEWLRYLFKINNVIKLK